MERAFTQYLIEARRVLSKVVTPQTYDEDECLGVLCNLVSCIRVPGWEDQYDAEFAGGYCISVEELLEAKALADGLSGKDSAMWEILVGGNLRPGQSILRQPRVN